MSDIPTREQWDRIDPDAPLTVRVLVYTSIFHDYPHEEITWTGTKAQIEQQAADYANHDMADYPLLHTEVKAVTGDE